MRPSNAMANHRGTSETPGTVTAVRVMNAGKNGMTKFVTAKAAGKNLVRRTAERSVRRSRAPHREDPCARGRLWTSHRADADRARGPQSPALLPKCRAAESAARRRATALAVDGTTFS